jgi:hypothetical protein
MVRGEFSIPLFTSGSFFSETRYNLPPSLPPFCEMLILMRRKDRGAGNKLIQLRLFTVCEKPNTVKEAEETGNCATARKSEVSYTGYKIR